MVPIYPGLSQFSFASQACYVDNIAPEILPSESIGNHPKVVSMKDLLKTVGTDALVELSHRLGKCM